MAEMRARMRSISDMAKDMHLKIVQMSERTANRIKEIEEDKERAIEKFNRNLTTDTERNARRRAEIEETYANRIVRTQERAMNAQKQAYARLARGAQKVGEKPVKEDEGFDLSAIGHLAQSAGLYRAGHLIRAAG